MKMTYNKLFRHFGPLLKIELEQNSLIRTCLSKSYRPSLLEMFEAQLDEHPFVLLNLSNC